MPKSQTLTHNADSDVTYAAERTWRLHHIIETTHLLIYAELWP